MSQQNKIIAALAAVAVLIAVAIAAGFSGGEETTAADTAPQPAAETAAPAAAAAPAADGDPLETPNPLGEIVLGQADAPVTIIEYSSLTCPHCGAFHRDTLPKLKADYIDKGLVKIYFRPFPFDPYATAGAMLAQCVPPRAQVNFLDILFKRQNQWIQSEDPMTELQKMAQQAGLSEADFVVCLKDQAKLDGIRTMQAAAAEKLGVRSTPTFFVNGEKLQGNQPYDRFQAVLKSMLP